MANNNAANQPPFDFLGLPAEVRVTVYHDVLDDRRMQRLRPAFEHPLVRACRQIRNEALIINDAGSILPLFPACPQQCPNSCLRPHRPSLLLARMGLQIVRRIGQIGDLFVSEQRLKYWLSPSGYHWGYEPELYDSEIRLMLNASMVPFGMGRLVFRLSFGGMMYATTSRRMGLS